MDIHMLTWMMMVCSLLRPSALQNPAPEVLNCCEGDVLFLVDSSGSVPSYDHARMLSFLSDLLRPFSLDPDQVRVGLLQVGTKPRLEFGFDRYSTQGDLQRALKNIIPLRGDTNTVEALRLAKETVLRPGTAGGAREGLPRVLVWLTDGVTPGDVSGPLAELREEGVAVLAVSTGHSNYNLLREVVSPPLEDHLHFVDVDDMSIITEDLRNAIIEIIKAERLQVRDISTNSASVHWRPVLAGLRGHYEIRYGQVLSGGGGSGSGTGTSPSTGGSQYQRLIQSADLNNIRLTGLKPETTYSVQLIPESNELTFNKLSTTFTTKPEVVSPAFVSVSDSSHNSVRVSWGPLQPETVTSYYIEYSALPRGVLQTLTVDRTQNSTLLRKLLPDTTYLVTVTARHASGKEKSMSVKVCTQEVTPALADLQLTTVGSDSVQVDWKSSTDGLRGYWVTWEAQQSSVQAQRSTLYLPADSLSTRLTHLPPSARVCVSPIYRTARGDGLCCTAQFHSDALGYGFQT
ncbi:PREDICTED: von Willebrand factor A domain-containing protein 1-like [Cyprinodon variegatus]|uniref:von Willebrand factor A domain-containing protein 1-like n=1 Tax=Cyprinodon variegatus TaxID=28743 RepID=UPI00074265E7|nr:PREDICTED: von Willebrand factor A domain-containing protein 1-like [Cyprinodon variegatus]